MRNKDDRRTDVFFLKEMIQHYLDHPPGETSENCYDCRFIDNLLSIIEAEEY